jgi:hypothetical protein
MLESELTHYQDDNNGGIEQMLSDHKIDTSDIGTRGSIECVNREDGNTLSFIVDSAWSPIHDAVDALISLPECRGVRVWYLAEEPGCGLYETNSDAEAESVHIDISLPLDDQPGKTYQEEEYFDDHEAAFKYLQRHTGRRFKSFRQAEKYGEEIAREQNNCCIYIYCHVYDYNDFTFGRRKNRYTTDVFTTEMLVEKVNDLRPYEYELNKYVEELVEKGIVNPAELTGSIEQMRATCYAILARFLEGQVKHYLADEPWWGTFNEKRNELYNKIKFNTL